MVKINQIFIKKNLHLLHDKTVLLSVTSLLKLIQEHGERAAVFALIAGILIVLTYPLAAWVLVRGGGAAAAIWLTAPEGSPSQKPGNSDDHEIH